MSEASLYPIPILLIVFNRLECLRQVFQRIREVRPQRLYVAADGPRTDRKGEAEQCAAVRDYVLGHIDWECQVETLFREQNLGCGKAVSSAISWFFSQEELGVILEDDCLVDKSFFPYAAELLERFRDDQRIGVISALNFLSGSIRTRHSYYFSRVDCGLWGWASWRRVWKDFDLDVKLFPELLTNDELFCCQGERERWVLTTSLNGLLELGDYNTWDYQLAFACQVNSRLSIVPSVNLVENLGVMGEATHTVQREISRRRLVAESMPFPLRHPPYIMSHLEHDRRIVREVFPQPPCFMRRWLGRFARKWAPKWLWQLRNRLR